ncbi:MAG: glutamine synthetase family protein [Formosimonas sp.]
MQAHEVKTISDVHAIIAERNITQVKVGVYDVDGMMRGKYMSVNKFLASLEGGFGFCDVVLGWDVDDQMYDNTTLTGWQKGYADAMVRILPDTCREMPTEPDILFWQAEFAGHLECLCPRGMLKKVLARCHAMGFEAFAGVEYEFLVTDEPHDALIAKDYLNIKPLGVGNAGYSVLRNSVNTDFYKELLNVCAAMNMPLEGLHEETGPGQLEAALTVDQALVAADNAALFKTFSKVVAQRQNRVASFMAKWHRDFSGQGGHIHMSLKHLDGSTAFFDETAEHRMSATMRHFVGGMQALTPQLMALAAPTINSYSRLVPGYWAPTTATWGVDNRTVGFRVIQGSAKSQRVEFRVAGADTNPYLAMAAALMAGLYGVEHAIEPSAPITGNGYAIAPPEHLKLPRSLWQAAQNLRASTAAREWLGDDFVDHYAASREWEEREFQRHVTDWERRRYFEFI